VKWWNPSDDTSNLIHLMKSKSHDFPGETVLDAGCGKGRFTISSLRSGAQFVLALDISPEMCHITKQRLHSSGFGTENCGIVVGDIERLPVSAELFDTVLNMDTLIHLANPRAALRELRRVTRMGGMIIVDVTSANPLRQLLDSDKGFIERVARFIYHCINVGVRLLAGERIFWIFHRTFLRSAAPWTPRTAAEFFRMIEDAGLEIDRWVSRGRYYAPTSHLVVTRKGV